MNNNFEMDFMEVTDNIKKFLNKKLLVLQRQPFGFRPGTFNYIVDLVNKAINDEVDEDGIILPTDIYHQCNHLLHYFMEEILLYDIDNDMKIYAVSWINLIGNFLNVVKEIEDNSFTKQTLQSKCTMIYQLLDTKHAMTNLIVMSKNLLRYYQRVTSHQNSSYNLSAAYLDNIRKKLNDEKEIG